MPSSNETAIRRLHDEVLSEGKAEVLDEIMAPDVRVVAPGGQTFSGMDEAKPFVTGWRQAFPDHHVTITHLIEQGDQVAIRAESDGTNTGEFMGQPPTGNKISKVSNLAWFTMEDGRIKESYLVMDETTLNNQLGFAQQG
jgi:steroid delta-isomerase-like uncharacterized protein